MEVMPEIFTMKEGLVPGREPEAIAKCLLMDFNSGLYSINLILILQNLLTAVYVHLDGLNGSSYLAHHVISYLFYLYIYNIYIYNIYIYIYIYIYI